MNNNKKGELILPFLLKNTEIMGTPFKMKGSPMQRNFGIGSPLHDHEKDKDGNVIEHPVIKPTASDTLKIFVNHTFNGV